MKIYKAMVIIASDVHETRMVDVIEHDGEFWLVPEWLDNQVRRLTKPLRIVSLRTLPHQRIAGKDHPPDFVVNDPVPKYVFDGRTPPQEADKYVVVEGPEIYIPLASRLH
jgi:hypothetical protein